MGPFRTSVALWPSSFNSSRRVEIILTRLRIGHTLLGLPMSIFMKVVVSRVCVWRVLTVCGVLFGVGYSPRYTVMLCVENIVWTIKL